ncbi:MAG: hypothetical protein WCG66_11300 [bacterium]
MIRNLPLATAFVLTLILSGCLASPVATSGGIGAVTVHDTNADAVMAAARSVFASRGYILSASNYPQWISFDKPAGTFGNVMWGNYGNPQTIRVRLAMVPIPGTDDIRLEPKVFSVSDAGEAGFDNARPLLGLWNAEFAPILKDIARKAGD